MLLDNEHLKMIHFLSYSCILGWAFCYFFVLAMCISFKRRNFTLLCHCCEMGKITILLLHSNASADKTFSESSYKYILIIFCRLKNPEIKSTEWQRGCKQLVGNTPFQHVVGTYVCVYMCPACHALPLQSVCRWHSGHPPTPS